MNVNYGPEVGGVVAEMSFFRWSLAAGITATLAETAIGVLGAGQYPLALGGANVVPATAVVADSDVNYWQVQVFKRSAGGAGVLIAQGSTSLTVNNPTGSWTAWKPMQLTVGGGAYVNPNDALTLVITMHGSPTTSTLPQLVVSGFTTVS